MIPYHSRSASYRTYPSFSIPYYGKVIYEKEGIRIEPAEPGTIKQVVEALGHQSGQMHDLFYAVYGTVGQIVDASSAFNSSGVLTPEYIEASRGSIWSILPLEIMEKATGHYNGYLGDSVITASVLEPVTEEYVFV